MGEEERGVELSGEEGKGLGGEVDSLGVELLVAFGSARGKK